MDKPRKRLLDKIEVLDSAIRELSNSQLQTKQDFLVKSGWDFELVCELTSTYLYEKNNHATICEDHAIEHELSKAEEQ